MLYCINRWGVLQGVFGGRGAPKGTCCHIGQVTYLVEKSFTNNNAVDKFLIST